MIWSLQSNLFCPFLSFYQIKRENIKYKKKPSLNKPKREYYSLEICFKSFAKIRTQLKVKETANPFHSIILNKLHYTSNSRIYLVKKIFYIMYNVRTWTLYIKNEKYFWTFLIETNLWKHKQSAQNCHFKPMFLEPNKD